MLAQFNCFRIQVELYGEQAVDKGLSFTEKDKVISLKNKILSELRCTVPTLCV